jgi:NTE family protein
MAPIAAVNADLTIAVSLGGADPNRTGVPPEPGPTTELINRMWRSTTALLDTSTARTVLDTPAARTVLNRFTNDGVEADDPDDKEASVPRLGGFEVMNRTIDIAQAALMRHTLAAYPPDLLIEVPRNACRSLEFHRADEVIEIGQELAAAALDALGVRPALDAGPLESGP